MFTEILGRYGCEEYVTGNYSKGYYDEYSCIQLILPVNDAVISRGHLVVGYAGVDGIEFCFRAEHLGIWAYYPYENNYELKASTLAAFVDGWLNGKVTV